jgi:predicted ATPase
LSRDQAEAARRSPPGSIGAAFQVYARQSCRREARARRTEQNYCLREIERHQTADQSSSINEIVSLAEKSGALMWKVAATFCRGYVYALTGKPLDGLALIEPNVAIWQSAGAKMFRPLMLGYTARAYLDAGKSDTAQHSIQEAMTAIQITGERWVEAEVNRVAGEIAVKSPMQDTSKAEALFQTALQIARQQQAKSWELRASMSLARLWRDQGDVQQARELLAPVYGWFTEGFDTRDLKEAKVLLQELQ